MTDPTTDPALSPDSHPADGSGDPAGSPANAGCCTGRRMIAVGKLTAHPGNVREDLQLTGEFCASVAANGVRVPLLITTDADGGYRVIEGHRRLAAAVKAGLAEVPYHLDSDRAGDEAGQFLDMVTANSAAYRKNFTPLQEATALFAAHEAGATRTRIRKVTGRKPDQIKTALAAGRISSGAREQVASLDRQLSLDELALVAEFEDDAEAVEQLLRAVWQRYPLAHVAERIRQDKAEAAEHERVRAELEASGCPITDQVVPGSMLLTSLAHDGQDLTEDDHRACPGHAAFFRSHDRRTPVFYCTDPAAHGHISRWAQTTAPIPAAAAGAADGDAPQPTPAPGSAAAYPGYDPAPAPVPDPAAEQARRRVIEGNKAWAAAWEVRKRWVAQLLWRRTAPKEITRFVAEQLLTMPDALRRGLPNAAGRLVFTELTGKPLEAVLRDCDTYPAARVPLLALAPIAIAYESEIAGDGERRNTWRTDRWAPCSRNDAARWLQFLTSLGYQPSAIEQAVADGVAYTGDDTPGEHDTGTDDAADEPAVNTGTADDGSDQADDHTSTTGPDAAELPGRSGGDCTDQAVA